MKKTTISIIVPIYNSEDTIGDCIESLIKQSFSHIDIILVNDGSSDQSGSICDDYQTKDDRIQVIHQSNKGRTEARHVGVQHAKGEWVAFVDSDDRLPETAIADLYEETSDDTDIILGNGYTLAEEHRNTIPMSDFRHLAVRGEGSIGVPWGSLYRKEKLTHYLFDLPRNIIMGEDYIFWLRLVFSTDKPVKIVYKSVYDKGSEHTSNSFPWTADYCYELNEYRKAAIPVNYYDLFLPDLLKDRIANLFSVAICQPKKHWRYSRYYLDIVADMHTIHSGFSWKQRLFLSIPSLKVRQWITRLIT